MTLEQLLAQAREALAKKIAARKEALQSKLDAAGSRSVGDKT